MCMVSCDSIFHIKGSKSQDTTSQVNELCSIYNIVESGAIFAEKTDFAIKIESDSLSDIATQYFSSVTYEVININTANNTATIEIHVPDLIRILSKVIDQVVDGVTNQDYEDILEKVKSELIVEISNDHVETITSQVDLELEANSDGKYMLIPNDNLYDIIYGSVEQTYVDALIKIIGGQSK